MNRQQIVLPASLIVIAVIVIAIMHGRNQARAYIHAKSLEIGKSIIETTNSPLVVAIGPGLRGKLSEFLSQPATVEAISLGDEPAPIGDGRASSQLWLINERGEHVVIRLRLEDGDADKFHILGFWSPPARSDNPGQ